ncbi:MAG TPA: D-alanyl-D-alanine carboxypeptidase/D-alanyl-D-alanine-endopeptidase [Gemmatimonadaceae bacterium]|nr:D-alanyl-D-alanine carboxypeptidase/D-alanyl-D-alanine-endopeptidase [Gemmatimonadaceae bacterium]
MTRLVHACLAFALLPLAACATATSGAGTGAPTLTPPVTRASLAPYIDSLVGVPEFRNAHWGVLVVDPLNGDTLYARNAGKLFMPASNMKLITGAVALDRLGPDYRFATTFAKLGTVADSTLNGHLLIYGRGDPSVSDAMQNDDALAPLRAVADSLRARGITRIAGRLMPGGDAFPDAAYGYGWSWDDFHAPYSAGVDELFFNEGFGRVTVIGGAIAGDSARIETLPLRSFPAVVAQILTASEPVTNGDRQRPRIRVALDSATLGVHLTGTIAPNDTFMTRFAYRDQPRAYLMALRQAFQERGISVLDSVVTPVGTVDSLFATQSPPLREILPVFEKPSQNQIGEILFKTIALEATGSGTADSARRVIARHLTSWGVDTLGFVVRDGSGLSRHDYLSPRAIVQLLDVMRRHEHFQLFYDALPIAGVDGTISNRMRDTPAQGNLRAKTGTLDKARALSGYVTTADGRLLLFSALANNYTAPLSDVTQVQDRIGAQLARLRLDLP